MWVLAALFCFARAAEAISYASLDYPGAKETYITGIDGDTIVGYYSNYDSFDYDALYGRKLIDPHNFVYDGQTWTTLDCPRVLESPSGRPDYISRAKIEGIDNGNIVGTCRASRASCYGYCGFIYDGQNWKLLSFPGARETNIQGIDGSNIAGSYRDATGYHGFVYDGTTWTTLLYPWIDSYTRIVGISGNKVAIYDLINYDGVIYNLDDQSWSTIEFPGAQNTIVLGIDGSNIIGGYGEGEGCQHYFLYNGTTWTTFDFSTTSSYYSNVITDLDGDNIVGYYRDATGVHGFIAAIPEPATLALLAFGGLILSKKKL